ncbi:cbb3-type cytochrome c oxidase subunit II [Pelagicoccus albus]|uniref:Cbb3-type cytochrome c oxidase subunit II n=1 Tax=Pelagicoccus albus TaxID=415222 RepID=A0A7X1B7I7_9BACT|nr:cbb3-type cytochrome c oxidase subunit II [Pelagicoccus albus]MBC2607120.1 cbb3-type cytochrome c oxidase subunit II [Pelagicoccus albus]
MKTMLILASLLIAAAVWSLSLATVEKTVAGEEVYIAEGCIHCHSQYSRPGSLDTFTYGPATDPDEETEGAVLIGNRRQGPDLSSIGLRRSRDWNRIHLINPQAVSPDSRMPSYKHLFEGAAVEGEALLDYLSALGIKRGADWYKTVFDWEPENLDGDEGNGAALFSRLCQQCHGATGGGDGELAKHFNPAPTNFTQGTFRFVPLSLPPENRRLQLARIIKYGQAGTSMPGHEYLTDSQIADLVAFVNTLSAETKVVK